MGSEKRRLTPVRQATIAYLASVIASGTKWHQPKKTNHTDMTIASSTRSIFISHAHTDKEIANNVVKMINKLFPVQQNQILCTSEVEYGLKVGDVIGQKLRQHLSEASVVLGLLTRNSLFSSWVTAELGAGWILGKVILPIQFDVCSELPGPLFDRHPGDGRSDEIWPGILDTIREEIGWPIPDRAQLAQAISVFLRSLPAPLNPLTPQDLDVIKRILSDRGCEDDAQVRLLEGPVQDKYVMGPSRSDDSQFLQTNYEDLCRMYDGVLREKDYSIPYQEVQGVFSLPQSTGSNPVKQDISVKVAPDRFVLDSMSVSHKLFQVQAFAQMVRSKRVGFDKPMVRLADIGNGMDGHTVLTIQQAMYSDQAQSNLVLNWSGNPEKGWYGYTGLQRPLDADSRESVESQHPNLRSMMRSKWGRQLPPLSQCGFLANTIGVSVILFCREGHELIPIINDRPPAPKAVFQHGWTCTASFALGFYESVPPGRKTSKEAKVLSELVEPWLFDAIETKSNISRNEIEWLVPIALCREFQRGGKPQLFYVGCVKSLTIDDVLSRFAKVPGNKRVHPKISSIDLQNRLNKTEYRNSYTSEFIANWYFAKNYFIGKL